MILNPYVFGGVAPPVPSIVNIPFEGPNGSTSFIDLEGHTLVGNGTPVISTAESYGGSSSLYLNGGSYITSPTSADFQFPSDFTVKCAANPQTLSATGVIYSNQVSNPDPNGFAFYRNGSSLEVWSGGATILAATGVFAVGVWAFVELRRVSGVLQLYSNGVAVGAPVANTFNFNSGIFNIGMYSVGGQYFQGYIDNFQITIP